MTLGSGLREASRRVENVDARLLLQCAASASRAEIAAHPERLLTADQAADFAKLVARRKAGEPIAYLVGEREFFGLNFEVTPDVLIPRPETELLVELALEGLPDGAPLSVLDLGTGSGAIAVTLAAHRPLAHVLAVDASEEALLVARRNSRRLLSLTPTLALPRQGGGKTIQEPLLPAGDAHDVCARPHEPPFSLPLGGGGLGWGEIAFARSDWFSAVGDQRFDLIVANPPYIAADDRHLERGDVRFEPRSALVGGEDGLQCIRHIVAHAREHLNPGGWLLFEHGYDQADACHELLRAADYIDILCRRDLAGIPRVAGGRSCT